MAEQQLAWRRSSRSGTQGDCVEVAALPTEILVRDSKDPHGPRLAVTPDEWRGFLAAVAR